MSSTEKVGVRAPQAEFSELMSGLTLGGNESELNGRNVAIPPRQQINGEGGHDTTTGDNEANRPHTFRIDAQKLIGHGSFGAVFLAKVVETDEMVAIKKVLQDKRFKNRELQIMKQLAAQPHPYIVTLKQHFESKGNRNDEEYLNLVLEYVPETIYSVAKYFTKRKESMPIFSVKLYMYQLARALAHIHGMGICHRDIKPHNLLVDPIRHKLKLCDFGSAKAFVPGEPNVAYICSRFYRAPELIFGSTMYSTAIDVWSHGCVFAELLSGTPVFPGSSGVDQLVEIIKVLGTPTKDELKSMNPSYQEFRFPMIRSHPWNTILKPHTPADCLDLVSRLLVYVPSTRLKSIETCAHRFFDELRMPTTTMPDGSPLQPELFQFTTEELVLAPELLTVLTPPHVGPQNNHFVSPINIYQHNGSLSSSSNSSSSSSTNRNSTALQGITSATSSSSAAIAAHGITNNTSNSQPEDFSNLTAPANSKMG